MLVSTDKGLRHNEGKVKVELVPPRWVLALAEVLTKGAEKYEPRNWEKGMEWSKCYASAQRHLLAFWDGEDNDKETGLPHVAHAAWNCLALLTYAEQKPGLDDRPGTKNTDRVERHPAPKAEQGTRERPWYDSNRCLVGDFFLGAGNVMFQRMSGNTWYNWGTHRYQAGIPGG